MGSPQLCAVHDFESSISNLCYSFTIEHFNMGEVNTSDPEVQRLTKDIDIVWNSEPGFKELAYSRVFNLRRQDRLPVAVVKVHSEADIVNAVKLANVLDVKISVISGGHSWPVWCVRDGAMLLDLGDYKEIDYNEDTETVTATTSVTGGILTKALAPKGRFFPGGHCPDVGIGGFLLQGGMGWGCRGWGWACQRIQSIKVVLADGQLVTCSRTENSDLFWLARGSGPGFPGVVVNFELKTLPIKRIFKSVYVYPANKFKEVLSWVSKTSPSADEDVETVVVSKRDPKTNEVNVIALLIAYKDTKEECLEQLDIFHSTKISGSIFETYGEETSITEEYKDQAANHPKEHYYRAENVFLDSESDPAEVLESTFTTIPNENTYCLYNSLEPLVPLEDMAVTMRSNHYIVVYTIAADEKQDQINGEWLSDKFDVLKKHSVGSYLGDSDFQKRITDFWSPEAHKRVIELRAKFDPKRRICGFLQGSDESKNNDI